MIEFRVPDRTRGHYASTITGAVKALDAVAQVDISLEEHRVRIASRLAAEALALVIREAGYTPQPL
jgi:copper chaperone CopZ